MKENILSEMFGEVLSMIQGPLNQLFVNLASEEGLEWLAEFKKFLRKEKCWAWEEHFYLLVDYSMTIKKMVKRGKYDQINSDVNSKNFPTTRKGKVEMEFKMFRFNKRSFSEEVIEEINKEGYRAAELHELLTFGEKYPDEQRKFCILALGSVWKDSEGYRHVACLKSYSTNSIDSKRELSIYGFGGSWHKDHCFLAVKS